MQGIKGRWCCKDAPEVGELVMVVDGEKKCCPEGKMGKSCATEVVVDIVNESIVVLKTLRMSREFFWVQPPGAASLRKWYVWREVEHAVV